MIRAWLRRKFAWAACRCTEHAGTCYFCSCRSTPGFHTPDYGTNAP